MSMKLKLSAIRVNLGLTQDEMAQKLGMSRQTYMQIEANPLKASVAVILDISQMSGVPVDMIDYGKQP